MGNSQGQKTGNDAYVTCRQQGTEQLNSAWRNGTSTVECHNPQTFCDARFASAGKNGQLCDKSCDAVGRCQNVGLGTNGDGTGDDGSGDTGSGDDDGSGDTGSDDDGLTEDQKVEAILKKNGYSGYLCWKDELFEEKKLAINKSPVQTSIKMIKAPKQTSRLISLQEKLAANGNWQCWCYANMTRTSGACQKISF